MTEPSNRPVWKLIGPGVLIAATGVGAGDLATGALVGGHLGVAILWAVCLGAFLKFVINEGLARWQLATGTTLLEGAAKHLGRVVPVLFLGYLLFWTFITASALMSACGIAAHALVPLFQPATDKIVYGILHSLVAVVMVRWGGYRLFERVMGVFIFVMFATVLMTTFLMKPDWASILSGIVFPKVPLLKEDGLYQTIALMGGVGGTVTVLCYGYWIREEGWTGGAALRTCRIDLAIGYSMTALFGMGMVILGSKVPMETGKGNATLLVDLSKHLEQALGAIGPFAKWAFLIGAWGAISSSLLGVWQSAPYLFADALHLASRAEKREENPPEPNVANGSQSPAYRWFLYGMATVPALGLTVSFGKLQLIYAFFGALFVPLLSLVLLLLNGRPRLVGKEFTNSKGTAVLLGITLVVACVSGWIAVSQ